MLPNLSLPNLTSVSSHELFNCFMIQPLWDTTNESMTHLELPFRAASVHDLYSLIIGFQPENIQHILNTNLIFLSVTSAHQVYRKKTDIISKTITLIEEKSTSSCSKHAEKSTQQPFHMKSVPCQSTITKLGSTKRRMRKMTGF